MKQMLSILAILVLASYSIKAQETQRIENLFSLNLELVKPAGRLTEEAYFKTTLFNKGNAVSYSVPITANGDRAVIYHCILVPELEKNDGTVIEGCINPFFSFGQNGILKLQPLSKTYGVHLPYLLCEDFGVLPIKKEIRKNFKRVRVKLKNILFIDLNANKNVTGTLYSNWLDLNEEGASLPQ